MHITEFIAKVQSVFDQLQSPDMHLFVPVDKDLNVVPDKSEHFVTSIRFAFTRSPAGKEGRAG